MKEKPGIVAKMIVKIGMIFGDGAKCQLSFFEPKKPEILKKKNKIL